MNVMTIFITVYGLLETNTNQIIIVTSAQKQHEINVLGEGDI